MADIKEAIAKVSPKLYRDKEGKPKPLINFRLVYDSPTSQLEPIYFWLLDFIQGMNISVEKIVDNFTSSPGSGHFQDMSQRTSKFMQDAMTQLGAISQVIKSILNLVYDLKEFELRLGHYKDAKSNDKNIKEMGILALKQIWMDNVDMKKGRGSINQMSFELGFTTLRDAFMISETIEDVKKNQIINEQVKRILIPRLSEFLKWQDLSEKELKKRYEIERSYLRSQVETVKLYTAWLRPYLKAAEQLRQKGFEKHPALVNAFSTTMFELVLFGKKRFDFESAVNAKELPPGFLGHKLKRNYFSCFVVSFEFRGHVGQKVTQKGDYGFALGGRVTMNFDCYALNQEELDLIEEEMKKQDVEDTAKILEEAAGNSLEQLKDDLDRLLKDEPEKEGKTEKKISPENPFSALFSVFKTEKKEFIKKPFAGILKPDSYIEKEVRTLSANSAKKSLYTIYDIYKKAHGMPSTPDPFDLGLQSTPVPKLWEAIKSIFTG